MCNIDYNDKKCLYRLMGPVCLKLLSHFPENITVDFGENVTDKCSKHECKTHFSDVFTVFFLV